MAKSLCRRLVTQKSPSPSRQGSGRFGLTGRGLWLVTLGLVALVTVLILWGHPLFRFSANVQQVRRFVASFGIWAPLVFIGLEITQVVLAPVPGGVIDLASGYLFGPGWGTFYSMTGLTGGTIIALYLARRFGRPVVERLVPSHTLDRLDRYARHRGILFFLMLFLMPFTPNDVICLLAGLTPLPLARLVFIAAIGRLPGVLVVNLTGNLMWARAAVLTPRQLLLIGVPLVVGALSLWRFQERIEEFALCLLARLDELIRR